MRETRKNRARKKAHHKKILASAANNNGNRVTDQSASVTLFSNRAARFRQLPSFVLKTGLLSRKEKKNIITPTFF